ncbi:hypothetical protein [Nesterenkonia sp. CF4.4]|uniref:hypothetical protein n=1 Tax=Nesterenkonia sp. CF4.4 TaxID=3373079 RepID=UPI003EE5881A
MARIIHQRRIRGSADTVGEPLNSLATPQDRLWPQDQWPPMRFDRSLGVAAGGHGSVRSVALVYRPLHDAPLEDALDRAASASGDPPENFAERAPWVRLLRSVGRA